MGHRPLSARLNGKPRSLVQFYRKWYLTLEALSRLYSGITQLAECKPLKLESGLKTQYTVGMRRCPGCKKKKPIDQFSKCSGKSVGVQSRCKKCCHDYYKSYYKRHTSFYKARAKRFIDEVKAWLTDLKAQRGCDSCPEKDPVCLDFHHYRGKKIDCIANLAKSCGRTKILAEIAKCSCLCANCHRKKHHSTRV